MPGTFDSSVIAELIAGLAADRRTSHPPLPRQPASSRRDAYDVPAGLAPAGRRRVQLRPDLRPRHDLGGTSGRRARRLPRPSTHDEPCLRHARTSGRPPGSSKYPWSIAVGGDFAYPGHDGKKPFGTDILNRYTGQVILAGQCDDAVVIRFNEVVSLVRAPGSLLSPPFAVRVLRSARRGASRTASRTAPGGVQQGLDRPSDHAPSKPFSSRKKMRTPSSAMPTPIAAPPGRAVRTTRRRSGRGSRGRRLRR